MWKFLKKLLGIKEGCACCHSQCSTENPAKNFFTEKDAEILKNADEHIVIGKILKISAHPDPKVTKVRVTQTEVAPGVVKQILCGGVNIEEGRFVPVAKVGTKFTDFEIGERKIRGELSSGMICSREELGLEKGDEPDHGIWLLDDDFAEKLGEKVRDIARL